MLTRRTMLGSLAALPLAGCFGSDDVTKRIKIIAKAEVDGKPVEGSTVMEITWHPRGDGGMQAWSLGEALILELDGKGTVYVLASVMHSDGMMNSGIWDNQFAYTLGIFGAVQKKDLTRIAAMNGRYPFVPTGTGAQTPVMVAFQDEADFRSVYRVDPQDFPTRFGQGVKFIGIEFEITDEPVTDVLKKRLPVLLQKDNSVPDSELRNSDGDLIAYVDLPFKYKIGQNTFFSPGRY